MIFSKHCKHEMRKSLLLLLVMAVSSFAWGQKPKAPSAPPSAPKPSAPAKPAAPAARPAQHAPAAPAQHPAAQNHAAPGRPASPTQRPGSATPAPAKTPLPTKSTGPVNRTAGPGSKPGPPSNARKPPTTPASLRQPIRNTPPKSIALKNGGKAEVRSNGQLRSLDKNGIHTEHNLHGGRTTVSERNGKRIVTNGKHGGYVQKPLAGHKGYYARTTLDHGVAHSAVYRGYSYGGHVYYGYQPAVFYSAGFYGWAGGAWATPLAWDAGAWGWAGAPWLGYYGFTPYGFYPGPAFWLTDYLLAADLQAAYAGLAGDGGISVIANQPWTDTGMPVIAGQTYVITASGLMDYNANTCAPGDDCLVTPIGQPSCIADGHRPGPGLACLSLIGKIGPDGAPFPVGARLRLTAPATGELYLGVNDDNFNDNTRGWLANVVPAGGDSNAVATQGMPAALSECDGNICGTWTWDGARYNATWSNGAVAVISVVRWDGNNFLLHRMDTAGVSAGLNGFYYGRLLSPNSIGGTAKGTLNGGSAWPEGGGWHATSQDAILAPSAGPAGAGAAASADPVALTPEVKEAIAGEVKAQIAAEKTAAASSASAQPAGDQVPPALDPARRNFVVASDLAVTTVGDNLECSLTAGDVITRLTETPDANQKVNASVTSAKKSDCGAGKLVSVSVDDLQEMRNHFQENLDAGLKTMAAKQGTHGMPKAPSTATVANSVQPGAPDATAASDLQAQQTAADQAETEARNEAAGRSGGLQ